MGEVRTRAWTAAALGALAMAFGAGPAQAQLLPPIGDGGGPGPADTTSEAVYSPPGEATAYGANPSRTGRASDPRVFGPLAPKWTVKLADAVNTPLVSDGRILVNAALASGDYGSRVLALDPKDGRILWQRSFATTYFTAPIAAAGGIVVAVGFNGRVHAYSIADGSPLWTRDLGIRTAGAPPLIDEGVVYVSSGGSGSRTTLSALAARDGAMLWSTLVSAPGSRAYPALDNERVYVAGDCGSAAAVFRGNGVIAWEQPNRTRSTCFGEDAIVADGRLFAGAGYVYDAVNGTDLGRLSAGTPDAVDDDVAYYENGGAVALPEGTRIWGSRFGTHLNPILSAGTLYMPRTERLVGLDLSTGTRLHQTGVGDAGHVGHGGTIPGASVGAGLLLVGDGTRLRAYRPLLRPGRKGMAVISTRIFPTVGKRIHLMAGLGTELRAEGARIVLRADPAPYGSFKRTAAKRSRTDGTAEFRFRIRRNTRFRAHSAGVERAMTRTVYAYPRYRLRIKRVSRNRGVVKTTVKKVPGRVLNRRRIIAYHGQAKRRRLVRIGAARLRRTGRRSAKARIGFDLLKRAHRRDYILVCVRGLARKGWGVNDRIARRCGANKISLRRARAAGGDTAPPAATDPRPPVAKVPARAATG